MTFTDPLKVS